MANIIDGKKIADEIREQLKTEVEEISKTSTPPGLAVVLVGEDPASKVYVKNKQTACEKVGIYSKVVTLPGDTSESQVLDLVNQLNQDPQINGILVQSPLPKQIDENKVINAISPNKDVDAFHPINVGHIMVGDYSFLPCTPAGIIDLIKSTGTDISGKHCVVIGRSNIVGKPMAMLLLHNHGTVTVCHSRTENLTEITKQADILVVAVGIPKMVTGDMIKPGAVVIDVGIHRQDDGKLCGDVDFDSAQTTAGYITPVPGGVGPMTITTLLKNTITAKKNQLKQD